MDCFKKFLRPGRPTLLLIPLAVLAMHGARAQDDGPLKPEPTRESQATLVVYNNLDPDSVTLAAYYAKRRGIPLDHIVGLNCPDTEEISRAQYDDTIAEPLRRIFADRGWWHAPADGHLPVSDNQIRFVALMRGIPLKIARTANYPGDTFTGKQQALDTNAAAVDSELATLGVRTRKISGLLKNPYYQSFLPFMDAQFAPIMLVCRLDGPTIATVENMIDGALAAERSGLDGFAYVDMRGITSGDMAEGDQWLSAAAVNLRQYGMPVISDTLPSLFPTDYPMDHAAVYLGWYSGTVDGPMTRDDFHFEPGAIAVHIHSFSASTLRDPRANWAGPLLAHGAAATIGNVYEPYLEFTPHLDVFVDRLRNGMNFAESAYASERRPLLDDDIRWRSALPPVRHHRRRAVRERGERGDRVRRVQGGSACVVPQGPRGRPAATRGERGEIAKRDRLGGARAAPMVGPGRRRGAGLLPAGGEVLRAHGGRLARSDSPVGDFEG